MRHTHLVGAALLSLVATPSQSSIFDRDDRQYVSEASVSPYSAIGIVVHHDLIGWRRTTGFLVDECHVLTTQSVLSRDSAPIGKRLSFRTSIATPQRQLTGATVVAAGAPMNYRTAREAREQGGQDWLLLRLDICLGARLGHVALATGPYMPFEFRDLKSAGYPSGRSKKKGLTIDPSCRVLWADGTVWGNDCASVTADAGDPIFRIATVDGKPQMIVYAMQSAGQPSRGPIPLTPGYENLAVPVALVAPQIQRYLSLGSGDRTLGKVSSSRTLRPAR